MCVPVNQFLWVESFKYEIFLILPWSEGSKDERDEVKQCNHFLHWQYILFGTFVIELKIKLKLRILLFTSSIVASIIYCRINFLCVGVFKNIFRRCVFVFGSTFYSRYVTTMVPWCMLGGKKLHLITDKVFLEFYNIWAVIDILATYHWHFQLWLQWLHVQEASLYHHKVHLSGWKQPTTSVNK